MHFGFSQQSIFRKNLNRLQVRLYEGIKLKGFHKKRQRNKTSCCLLTGNPIKWSKLSLLCSSLKRLYLLCSMHIYVWWKYRLKSIYQTKQESKNFTKWYWLCISLNKTNKDKTLRSNIIYEKNNNCYFGCIDNICNNNNICKNQKKLIEKNRDHEYQWKNIKLTR